MASNHLTPQYKQAEHVFDLCMQYHETQGKHRIIAETQHRSLKDYDGPSSLEAQKIFLEKRSEKSKSKSWYEYGNRLVKSTLSFAP